MVGVVKMNVFVGAVEGLVVDVVEVNVVVVV